MRRTSPPASERSDSLGESPPPTSASDAARFLLAPWLAENFVVYEALMEALIESIRAQGTPVLLVVLPGSSDILPGGTPDVNEAIRLGRQWETEGRIAFLDLTSPLATLADNGGHPFLATDRHFSVEGNALVGRLLAEKVRDVLAASNQAGSTRQHTPQAE